MPLTTDYHCQHDSRDIKLTVAYKVVRKCSINIVTQLKENHNDELT